MGQGARERLAPTQKGCSPFLPAPILSWREGVCAWLGWPLLRHLQTSIPASPALRVPSLGFRILPILRGSSHSTGPGSPCMFLKADPLNPVLALFFCLVSWLPRMCCVSFPGAWKHLWGRNCDLSPAPSCPPGGSPQLGPAPSRPSRGWAMGGRKGTHGDVGILQSSSVRTPLPLFGYCFDLFILIFINLLL